MAEIRQQAELSAGVGGPVANAGFLEHFRANILASGLSPRKTMIGFVLAWSLFFFILYGMPAPAGLSRDALKARIESERHWSVRTPAHLESITL